MSFLTGEMTISMQTMTMDGQSVMSLMLMEKDLEI